MNKNQQLQKRLLTYSHLGELSFSEEEIQQRIKVSEDKIKHSICESLQNDLEDNYFEQLEKLKGMYRIEYIRDSFWAKLFRRKNHPQIILTAPIDAVLQRLGRYPYYLDNIDLQLHNEFQERLRQREQHRQEEEKRKRFNGVPFQDNTDPRIATINPEHICLVHATKYLPPKNSKGEYEIQTLSTATHLKYLRNTIHFALNHHVHSHLEGAWDKAPYVILIPLTDVSKLNNTHPMGLSVVDTFFEMDLNQNLRLPIDSTFLIQPAPAIEKFEKGHYFKIGKHRAFYKTSFSEQEKKELMASSDDKKFWTLSSQEQNKILSSKVKLNLVRKVLRKMGYQDNFGDYGDEYDAASPLQKINRLGKKLNIPSTAGRVLHAGTVFGQNVLCDNYSSFSPPNVGNVIDFITSITQASGTVYKPDFYVFIDSDEIEHPVRECDLQEVYKHHSANGKGDDYMDMVDHFIHTLLDAHKDVVMTQKSKNVFNAWLKHQKELWAKNAPLFFKKYPTIEALETVCQHKKNFSNLVDQRTTHSQR